MKRIARYLPLYTLAAGTACAVLRRSLFAAMDERGLLPLDHPANILLIILPILSLALLVIYYLQSPGREFRASLSVPVQAIGCLAAAAGLLYWYFSAAEEVQLFSLFKLLAAGSFAVLAAYRWLSKKPPLLIFALISLSMMALCFGQYRGWGQHTQLQEYLFPALSALLLALYSLEACTLELPERSYKKAFILNQAALFTTLACLNTASWPYYLAMSVWLISGLFTKPYAMVLPKDVQKCIEKLQGAGFTAHAVGGCVRDAMLGLTPHDYDLCTNATPEDICQVFRDYQLIRNGEKHGTVGVVMNGTVYEITTYRTEGGYEDNRHPDHVDFVDRVEEDLARRDFTVNAMAFHPKAGYIDPFGGQKDLQAGFLRAVGDPETRFREDALRILRGVRFACRFRLEVEPKTKKAMEQLAPLLDNLARERVCSEMTQILCHMQEGDLLKFSPVILQVVPEMKGAVGFQQHNPHHAYDVFTHTGMVLSSADADPALRWAALLHDVGKPQVFTQDENGKGHFYGHAKESAQIADDVLRRLKASTALREQVIFLVEHHMDSLSADKAALRRKLSKYGMDNLKKLIALQRADRAGKGRPGFGADSSFDKMLRILQQLEDEEGCLQIRDLAVNGHDLMQLGFAPGPKLGQCQQQLLELVLSEELPNEKTALLKKAAEYLEQ